MNLIFSKIKGFYFILVVCFLISSVNSMESTSTPVFPEKYIHKPVQAQLKDYRAVYDKVSSLKGRNFYTVHVEGLFTILSNGFALANQYIREKGIAPEDSKEILLALLTKLYEVATLLNSQGKMTQNNFVTMNLLMADLVDMSKKMKLVGNDINERHVGVFETLQKSSVENFWDAAIYVQGKSIFEIKNWWMGNPLPQDRTDDPSLQSDSEVEVFYPPMIVYTDRESKIAPATFVDQTLHEDYGAGLMLFDVDSKLMNYYKPERTKKDPHYSQFTGTYQLLLHDQMHILEQYMMEYMLKYGSYHLDWGVFLHQINALRNRVKNQNENASKILTNGLFILCHELLNVSYPGKIYEVYRVYQKTGEGRSDYLPDKATFDDVIRHIKKCMALVLWRINRSDDEYKIDYRDHEFILKNVTDLEGNPILSMTSLEEFKAERKEIEKRKEELRKIPWEERGTDLMEKWSKTMSEIRELDKKIARLFESAYEKFWDTFLQIISSQKTG